MIGIGSTRSFLTMTFLISLCAFALMVIVPGAESPESATGLPIWFLAIWSPTLSAGWLLYREARLGDTLRSAFSKKLTPAALCVVGLPFLVASAVLLVNPSENISTLKWSALTPGLVLSLFAFNLVLGPLGEELGWRGYLLPAWEKRIGWLPAALAVGVVWAVWHAPLWLVDSPQRAIPLPVFFVHVMAYSVIMARAQQLANNSLWPAILLHLGFNVVGALVVIAGVFSVAEWYNASASIYVLVAICLALVGTHHKMHTDYERELRISNSRHGFTTRIGD